MEYQCKGFLEKNRDTLYEELIDIMRVSKVSACFIKANPCRISTQFNTFSPAFNCYQFPLLANFFQEEERNSVNSRGVKVRPARPGVKPTNKQLRTSVGDKVKMLTHRHRIKLTCFLCVYPFWWTLWLNVVLQLPLFTDGNAECYHPPLCALH